MMRREQIPPNEQRVRWESSVSSLIVRLLGKFASKEELIALRSISVEKKQGVKKFMQAIQLSEGSTREETAEKRAQWIMRLLEGQSVVDVAKAANTSHSNVSQALGPTRFGKTIEASGSSICQLLEWALADEDQPLPQVRSDSAVVCRIGRLTCQVSACSPVRAARLRQQELHRVFGDAPPQLKRPLPLRASTEIDAYLEKGEDWRSIAPCGSYAGDLFISDSRKKQQIAQNICNTACGWCPWGHERRMAT